MRLYMTIEPVAAVAGDSVITCSLMSVIDQLIQG